MIPTIQILCGDALEQLRTLPDVSVNCCVTSPPYWGLRDYNVAGQIGLEKTPAEYVAALVAVFSEVRRVLRNDGTLWLNVGDSYNAAGREGHGTRIGYKQQTNRASANGADRNRTTDETLKPKDLIGIPWLLAFALRNDGWYLRSEITWCKKAPMPESVKDRPTCATEKIFLLSKSPKYYYNADAVRTPPADGTAERLERNGYAYASGAFGQQPHSISQPRPNRSDKQRGHGRRHAGFNDRWDSMPKDEQQASGANMRNYWLIGPENFSEAHFAVFPSEIPRRAILAGCPVGGAVLDCFAGAGTTGMVATELGRKSILIELNTDYVPMIRQRCNVTPGLPI